MYKADLYGISKQTFYRNTLMKKETTHKYIVVQNKEKIGNLKVKYL